MKSLLLLVFFSVAFSLNAMAQKNSSETNVSDKTRILIILDCSNSMWDKWQSDSKIKVTQTVLLKFLDSINHQEEIDVALRVFGHLNKKSYGTRLEVPFENDNNYKLQSKIKTLVPQGGCEVVTALSSSLNDFPNTVNSRNIILIITDGIDDCEGSICEVAKQVQNSGVIVKTFVLGIGEKENFQSNLNCAGKFIHVAQEEKYAQSLYEIFTLSEEKADVKIKIKDKSEMEYETTLPIVFYDNKTGVAKYQMIYSTESDRGNDVLTIDPLISYNIEVYSKPSVVKQNVSFDSEKQNELVFQLEQGLFSVGYEAKRTTFQVPEYPIVVRKHGTPDVVNVQNVNQKVYYLAGKYDVEILTEPSIKLTDVEIRHVSNTELTIPTPGAVNVTKPKMLTQGCIFVVNEDRWEYVCDLNSGKASERVLLMPGEYVVVLKPLKGSPYGNSNTKKFRVEAGMVTNDVV